MNKKYIFPLIAVVTVVLVVVAYSILTPLTLDQIIKNKDCVALDKWENEHMFDDNLNVSSEQMSSAMKLAMECVGKALKNMSGSSDSSHDVAKERKAFDDIFKMKGCLNFNVRSSIYLDEYDTKYLTEKEIVYIDSIKENCTSK